MTDTIDLSTVAARKEYQQKLLRDLVANREALQEVAEMDAPLDDAKLLAQKRLAIKEVKEQSEVIIALLKALDD